MGAYVTLSNGIVTDYDYNSVNQLTTVTVRNANGDVISSYSYGLDATGRRESITEEDGRLTEYNYDGLYRLTNETITETDASQYISDFVYDFVGNRQSQTVGGVETVYTYDMNDRIQTAGDVAYTYDLNGNTLTETEGGTVKTYSYDARNKMVGLNTAVDGTEAASNSYGYNHSGIRTSKTVDGVETAYVVDSNRDYAQVLLESTGVDSVLYSYGHDLVSQKRGSDFRFYLYDGLGSTRGLVDSVGNVTDEYDYTAFGDTFNVSGSSENAYLYTGEQQDAESGQYYLRARYYDAGVGRFTSMDTYAGRYLEPVTLHKYLYANADPVMYTDPTGNFGFGLGGFGGGMMTNLSYANTAINIFQIATGDEKLTPRKLGTSVLLRMLPGSSALKIMKFTKKGKKPHGNSKKSTKPQHLYAIIDLTDGSIYKYGISGTKLNLNGTSGRANGQANKLNKTARFDQYQPTVLHKNIINREVALAMEYGYVYGYKSATGKKPIGNKRP